ncbi:N-acetyltransferase, partial [bacterium]|nr:N-acetyltransferase [bacterium]
EITAATIVDRLHHILADGFPWIVLENEKTILGYAYATKFRDREAYRYTAESTVYLDPGQTGRGYGAWLYRELLDRLKHRGIHVVIGVISLPNPASVRLHESLGFTQTAHLQQVGFKFGQWIDVGDWQLIL